MSLDHSIVVFFNQFTEESTVFAGATIFFANYFPYVLSALFILFVIRRERKKAMPLAQGFSAAIISWLCSQALQFLVHRLRPFAVDSGIQALIEKTSYSFPSGHASFFFALATVAYLYDKRVGIWFYVASSVIGFARIAAGVHYPTDILGGAVLGVLVGLAVHQIYKYTNGTNLLLRQAQDGERGRTRIDTNKTSSI